MKQKIREIAVFAVLGVILFVADIAFEALPNIHLVGVLIVAITAVYRVKALFPIYVYVFLNGLYGGFSTWWIPYIYVWAVLWGFTMLLPREMPKVVRPIAYSLVCGLHGFLFGTLYAPFQAIFFGLDFNGTISWIIAGLPFDLVHGVSNILCGALICPIIMALRRAEKFTN
ncbi:MAG: hypothetical protein E7548_02740 [Ruminococcaceae bacterium]|nr:hypothetical protein [Oscillospiraceae bacterium]